MQRIALLLYASLGNLLTSTRSCSLLDENIYYLVLVTFDLATKDVTHSTAASALLYLPGVEVLSFFYGRQLLGCGLVLSCEMALCVPDRRLSGPTAKRQSSQSSYTRPDQGGQSGLCTLSFFY
jgi:hypothetical protein